MPPPSLACESGSRRVTINVGIIGPPVPDARAVAGAPQPPRRGTLTRPLHGRPLPKGEAGKENEKVGADGGDLADRKMGAACALPTRRLQGRTLSSSDRGGVWRPLLADEKSAVPDIDESTEH